MTNEIDRNLTSVFLAGAISVQIRTSLIQARVSDRQSEQSCRCRQDLTGCRIKNDCSMKIVMARDRGRIVLILFARYRISFMLKFWPTRTCSIFFQIFFQHRLNIGKYRKMLEKAIGALIEYVI